MQINAFWHGTTLPLLQRMCISSFLAVGLEYHLYVYDEPDGVPNGVTLRDAESVVPRSRVFTYQAGDFNLGSVAGFSNLFRYALIESSGGWWVDTDVCCLRPFDFTAEEVFFREETKEGSFYVATAMFKAAKSSETMQFCRRVFDTKDVTKIVHGETGPRLLTEAVLTLGHENAVHSPDKFFPVPWWEYDRLFFDEQLNLDDCFTVHFFDSLAAWNGLDPNACYPEGSFFAQLKRRYLGV